jgi:hypothetical protein
MTGLIQMHPVVWALSITEGHTEGPEETLIYLYLFETKLISVRFASNSKARFPGC